MKTVLISGGSGFVGRKLTTYLLTKGIDVVWLSRSSSVKNAPQNVRVVSLAEVEQASILHVIDGFIHLAGANIADGYWTSDRKSEILQSRVKPLHLLLGKMPNLKVLVSASGTAIYPLTQPSKPATEDSEHDSRFLADVVKEWEAAAYQYQQNNVRVVCLRTGVVLGRGGGMMGKIQLPLNFGVLPVFGSGEQPMPWIHLDDLVALYAKALFDEQCHGIYNAVAPEFATNKSFVKTCYEKKNKRHWVPPIPEFVLKLAMGEMSELLLSGRDVANSRVKNSTDFSYSYPTLDKALSQIIS